MVSYVINFILLLHPDSISRYHIVDKVNQKEIIMNKQVFNPYLPSWEYVPDGEPHVFGDRLYLYGSHDRFNGELYCLNDYVCWSAPVNDLTAWKYEGVIYRGEQDPNYDIYPKPIPGMQRALYAPDVTRDPDGRYYLYYAFDFVGVISVAVSDSPAGPFEYYGDVHHQDGQVYGRELQTTEVACFLLHRRILTIHTSRHERSGISLHRTLSSSFQRDFTIKKHRFQN